MYKRDIIRRTEEILNEILVDEDIFLVEVDYTKENNIYYLKVYLDTEDGITIDQCSDVSRILSNKLDELDYIEDSYFLEVSSPGIDRPFKTNEDFKRNLNKLIEVNLYAKKNGEKLYVGKLINIEDDSITIKIENKENKEIKFKIDEIAKANKHIEI
ncbi:MAG: ribosome maturation factor RimP [Tissierellales bacterium]|jgi:ribosome maturation factor RimP|nr:ribosome maturation factor RimP [Tissierellales bacterium]